MVARATNASRLGAAAAAAPWQVSPKLAAAPPLRLPAPLPWRAARARAGMKKLSPDTRENFGDGRARCQGRARGCGAGGVRAVRALRGER